MNIKMIECDTFDEVNKFNFLFYVINRKYNR